MLIGVEPDLVSISQSRRRYTLFRRQPSHVSPVSWFPKPCSRNQQRQTRADRKKTPAAAPSFLAFEATRQAISVALIQCCSNPAELLQSPSIGARFKSQCFPEKFQVIQLEIHRGFHRFLKHFLSIEVDLIVTLILQLNV
jgi:hypothetical protein